jgi:hypothetical protein
MAKKRIVLVVSMVVGLRLLQLFSQPHLARQIPESLISNTGREILGEEKFQHNHHKFLLYYTHSGFSNQLICLDHAASFALATNRTLVISPVRPHNTFPEYRNDNLLFPEFEPAIAGGGCKPYINYHTYIKKVQEHDVKAASDPKAAYPSVMDLFDFGDIYQKTGLEVIDMREFAQRPENINITSWCTGEKEKIEGVMVPACEHSKNLDFSAIASHFQTVCGLDKRVAVIGSPFVLPAANGNYSLKHYFENELMPSKSMLLLLKQIHSHFPEPYAGVAIRFKDNMKVNCDDFEVERGYQQIFHNLLEKRALLEKDATMFVLVSNGNVAALKCFRHHAQKEKYAVNVTTVNDIIDRDKTARRLMKSIKSEVSTIYLLLDQILVALANEVVYQKIQTSWSTFHMRILALHSHKETILEKMQQVEIPSPIEILTV